MPIVKIREPSRMVLRRPKRSAKKAPVGNEASNAPAWIAAIHAALEKVARVIHVADELWHGQDAAWQSG